MTKVGVSYCSKRKEKRWEGKKKVGSEIKSCLSLFCLGGKVPQDRTIEKEVLRKVSLSLFISMSTVAAVGIVWGFFLIFFTYIYRDRK
jgi:hypothetical protein